MQLENLRVVIVGAGASGLAAAGRLVEKGLPRENIVICEAQDRIGGRIYTQNHGNAVIEIGAQWIHGEKDNVVYDMAIAAGEVVQPQCFLGLATHERVDSVLSSGEIVTQQQREQFQKVMEFIYVMSLKELSTSESSYGDYFAEKFKAKLRQGELGSTTEDTAWALFDWYHRFQNTIDGSDSWLETCASGHLEYHECEGDPTINWKRGYSTVLDLLLKNVPRENCGQKLPLSSRILLNKPVKTIHLRKGKVVVECQDGTLMEADCALVTCSLGYLKENPELFDPELPARKQNAIRDLGFGTVNKLFLRFDNPWWPEDWDGINFLRLPQDGSEWHTELLGFYVVRNQPNLLMSWLTGPAARHVEQLQDAVVMETCSRELKKFLGGRFQYTEPSAYFASKWHSNKYVRGSYSFRSTKSKASDVWAQHLAEPVADETGTPRIFFAGEATSDHFYSTVHGAVESGWREAERIVSHFKTGKTFVSSHL